MNKIKKILFPFFMGLVCFFTAPLCMSQSTQREENDIFNSHEDIVIHQVYPIPAKDFLEIKYTLKSEKEKAQFQIHNILGNKIIEIVLSPQENKHYIELKNIPPGIYFYTLLYKGNVIMARKIKIY